MLNVKNLTYKYDEKKVLNNINLFVNDNEKIAILGNNGAGKTTLFMCLIGVYHDYTGEIESTKRIGLVFQEPDVQIIGSTVEKEISFGPMNMSKDKKWVKNQIDKAISEMKIEHLRDRATHYLSGGEKKLVCIADICAMDSDILILDEPNAYLDPLTSDLVEEKLIDFHNKGNTIILSTHDIDFAYRFANRFIILSHGEIIADGGIEVFRNDDILQVANLKKPTLFSIMECMGEEDLEKYPKNIEEFKRYQNEKGNNCN